MVKLKLAKPKGRPPTAVQVMKNLTINPLGHDEIDSDSSSSSDDEGSNNKNQDFTSDTDLINNDIMASQ